ncbi:MAG: hypothetical protein ACYCST_16320 [Acidimicrobiales bacterium]
MSGEGDLRHLLDGGAGPEPTAEVLAAIVARHRRRRARNHRAAATAAVVVILAGATADLGLRHSPQRRSAAPAVAAARAAGPTSAAAKVPAPAALPPPAGLKWDVALHLGPPGGTSGGAFATSPVDQPTSAHLGGPAPGEFGFAGLPSLAPLSLSGLKSEPAASVTDAGGGYVVAHADGCTSYCEVVYAAHEPVVLFKRQLRRAVLTVSLERYSFPVSRRARSAPVLGAPAAVTVKSRCPTSSELIVKVSDGATSATLYVPIGGRTSRPLAVVASATTTLPGGKTMALAIARTSASVASVAARFGDRPSYSMAPKDHWVVLASILPATVKLARAGTVAFTASSGSAVTLERARVASAGSLATAPVTATCEYLVRPPDATGSPPPVAASSRG